MIDEMPNLIVTSTENPEYVKSCERQKVYSAFDKVLPKYGFEKTFGCQIFVKGFRKWSIGSSSLMIHLFPDKVRVKEHTRSGLNDKDRENMVDVAKVVAPSLCLPIEVVTRKNIYIIQENE